MGGERRTNSIDCIPWKFLGRWIAILAVSSFPVTMGILGHALAEDRTIFVDEFTLPANKQKLPGPVEQVEGEEFEETESPDAVVHIIEPDDEPILSDPWELVGQANTVPTEQAPELLLEAINEFIDQGQMLDAQSTVDILNSYSLTPDQLFSFQVSRARLANATGQHEFALYLIAAIDTNQVRDPLKRRKILGILLDAQVALGKNTDAVITIIQLDALLRGDEQLQNQHRLLGLLQNLNPLQISLLKERYKNDVLYGWLALHDTLQTTSGQFRTADLADWGAAYPNHPAQSELIASILRMEQLDDYRQIALLLPLTSDFGEAAKAFYDGFMKGHEENFQYHKPEVVLYDIGAETNLVSFYYLAAINDGADFVVGPLGRNATSALLSQGNSKVPTLVIADIPPGNVYGNLFGISLSPEKEAVQVAERAFAQGHRQATIFRSDSAWGTRVADAFEERWQELGGIAVKNSSFPRDISDYSRIIQKFLGLDRSLLRHQLLEAQVKRDLKFSTRRNQDIDFIFLAANASQARLVVPQLRFFKAHDLPIYATSYVYSGKPNPAEDHDLEGIIFADMPWILDSVELYRDKVAEEESRKEAEQLAADRSNEILDEALPEEPFVPIPAVVADSQAVASGSAEGDAMEAQTVAFSEQPNLRDRPYQETTLDRLYALGLQSYQLVPRLNTLRSNDWGIFAGDAMTVSVDSYGSVNRHPVWVTFRSGLVEPLDGLQSASSDR